MPWIKAHTKCEMETLEQVSLAIASRGWAVEECRITKTRALIEKESDLLIGFFPMQTPSSFFLGLETCDQVNAAIADTGWSITETDDCDRLVWCLWNDREDYIERFPIGIPSAHIRRCIESGQKIFDHLDDVFWTSAEHCKAIGLT